MPAPRTGQGIGAGAGAGAAGAGSDGGAPGHLRRKSADVLTTAPTPVPRSVAPWCHETVPMSAAAEMTDEAIIARYVRCGCRDGRGSASPCTHVVVCRFAWPPHVFRQMRNALPASTPRSLVVLRQSKSLQDHLALTLLQATPHGVRDSAVLLHRPKHGCWSCELVDGQPPSQFSSLRDILCTQMLGYVRTRSLRPALVSWNEGVRVWFQSVGRSAAACPRATPGVEREGVLRDAPCPLPLPPEISADMRE